MPWTLPSPYGAPQLTPVIGGDDSVGGTPSEGVDVASSSFPLVKNQGLIEPIGL